MIHCTDRRQHDRPRRKRQRYPVGPGRGLERLEARTLLSAGDLDLSFGVNGKVLTDFSLNSSDSAFAMAVQADGKLVVAGSTGATGSLNVNFAVARYLPDGSLDSGFGNGGKTVINFTSTVDEARAVLIDSNSRIVVGGAAGADFALARLLPTGQLDSSFGVGGKVITDFGGAEQARALALAPGGRIIAAGSSLIGSNMDFAVARYLPSGALDSDFSADGRQVTDFGGTDSATGAAVLEDGRIVVAGTGADAVALARYLPDGTLDGGFGNSGKVTTNLSTVSETVGGLALQPDGKIVVAGSAGNDFALVRYQPNGARDVQFGSQGVVFTDFAASSDAGTSLAFQINGKIIVAGQSSAGGSGLNFALARYHPNGALDSSFSFDGKVLSDVASGSDSAQAVAVLPEGQIVVAGRASTLNGSDFALARYHGDPVPAISIDDLVVLESASSAVFTVRLQEPATETVSVQFATRNGTAHANSDYAFPIPGTVTIGPGRLSQTISISLLDDQVQEPNEDFFVDLTQPVNGRIVKATARAVIVDDDAVSSTISGFVYEDTNFNGRRDPGEPGIGGVTVRLSTEDRPGAQIVLSRTTSSSGQYVFANIPAGRYFVEETQPSGVLDGREQVGLLGGALLVNDRISNITVPLGVHATDYNFGEHRFVFNPIPPLFPNRTITTPVAEGSEAVLRGTIFDANPNDRFILEVDWGDGSPLETHQYGPGSNGRTVAVPHRYRDNGSYTVHVAWRDPGGLGNSDDLTVVVTNAAPQLRPLQDVLLGPGAVLSRAVRFEDAGADDQWTARIDFGDGTTQELASLSPAQPFRIRHVFAEPGTYQVKVAVIDDDGEIGTDSFLVRVLAAPVGGRAAPDLFGQTAIKNFESRDSLDDLL